MKSLIALFAIAIATPALAEPAKSWADEPWSYEAKSPYGYSDPQLTVAEQIAINNEHATQTYNRIRDNGGCNADFITTAIATYCNKKAFGGPQMGSEGGE